MIINKLPKYIIICLLFTIIVELLVAIILGVRNKKDIINIILVNIMTNPLVVTIPQVLLLFHGMKWRNISLLLLELYAFIGEGLIYKKVLKYNKINGLILSLILNLSSYFLGYILNYLNI